MFTSKAFATFVATQFPETLRRPRFARSSIGAMFRRCVPTTPERATTFAQKPAVAGALFAVTLGTCLVAGTQFAVAFAHNESFSMDEFFSAFKLLCQHPAALLGGFPSRFI